MIPKDGGRNHGPERSEESRPARRRRRVLEAIRDSARPLRLEELARAVVGRETPRGTLPEGDDGETERVRILLHHVDLPKLQTRGAIEYDPSRRLVS